MLIDQRDLPKNRRLSLLAAKKIIAHNVNIRTAQPPKVKYKKQEKKLQLGHLYTINFLKIGRKFKPLKSRFKFSNS